MEYVVGIKFTDKDTGKIGAYLTWGRIFDAIDDKELLEIVSKRFKGLNPKLCRTLQEVKDFPYFYEELWKFSQEHRPMTGEDSKKWKQEMAEKMRQGAGFYLLGYLDTDKNK